MIVTLVPAPIWAALDFVLREWSGGRLQAIRLNERAAAGSVSSGEFARQFRGYYSVGAATALEKLRLAHAASILVVENTPLAVVATECGFADPYHFSRRFTATYGVPPGRYRRSVSYADPEVPLAHAGLRAAPGPMRGGFGSPPNESDPWRTTRRNG